MSLVRFGFSEHIVEPQGTGANGVLFLGEAPGAREDAEGIPFSPHGDSGAVLNRCIRRVGMNREQFVITNVVPYRPPNNWLEGAPYMDEAISESAEILDQTIATFKPKAIVALGGVALRTATGLAGPKLGVSSLAGYVLPSRWGIPTVASFHPAFIRRGKVSHMSVLMRAIRLACQHPQVVQPDPLNPPEGYITHPTEAQAQHFLEEVEDTDWQTGWLAYDIETFWSNAEESAEEFDNREIKSIQFSLRPNSGIYLPGRAPFIDTARRIMSSGIRKAGWNNWRFDDPVLRAAGFNPASEIQDLMWAWHHQQPDLPRGLQFAAAHQGPNVTQPSHRWLYPWKHLDAAHPQFYGIVDVDVLQWMLTY